MPKCTKCGAKFVLDKGRKIQFICQSCRRSVLREEALDYQDGKDYIEFNRFIENLEDYDI